MGKATNKKLIVTEKVFNLVMKYIKENPKMTAAQAALIYYKTPEYHYRDSIVEPEGAAKAFADVMG